MLKFDSENLGFVENKKKFLNQYLYFIMSMIFVVVTSVLLSETSVSFPDYPNYDTYIERGTSYLRFNREPLAATVMYILHLLSMSAKEYYIISTILLFYSFYRVTTKINSSLSFFCLIFLCLNPITLILIQTPRHAFSMGLVLLSLSTKGKKSYLYLLLSILSHTVMGAVGLFFFFTSKMKNKYNVFASIISCVFFVALMLGLIPSDFAMYESSEIQRGVGRTLLFAIFAVFAFVFMKKNTNERRYLQILSAFSMTLYLLTPFAHRISAFVFILIVVYIFSNLRRVENIIALITLCCMYLFASIFIIYNGMYGYSS